MVFSSVVFLFYFLPLFFAVFVVGGFSKAILLTFSLIFYAWGEAVFLPLVLAMIAANHWFGQRIEDGHANGTAKRWVTIAIVVNLTPLLVFKYGAFLLGIVAPLLDPVWTRLGGTSLAQLGKSPLPLPLGISFYTFHALSYLIDVFRKDVKAERSLRDLAVYTLMFPQLIAGPIIRFKTIAGELHNPVITPERVALGIQLFVTGLAQKTLIANTVAVSADAIFALAPNQLSAPVAWVGIVCYTMQIFFDFSGYSTMAIGLGLMIGFTFPQNFNYPYAALSMTDFWRRWHISLSSWFRDYVYVPLGGNRSAPWRTYVNLCTVFLLCGLWHGAAWNFVAWGAAHGALLVLERAGFGAVLERWPRPLRHAYVMLAAMLTWVLFRADTLRHAGRYMKAMFGFGADATESMPFQHYLGIDVIAALALGLLAVSPFGARLAGRLADMTRIGSLEFGRIAGMVILVLAITLSLAAGSYNPFIYFRF